MGKTISIHAPTRGATFSCAFNSALTLISIHAPTRGATEKYNALQIGLEFQSTLPHGERPRFFHDYIYHKAISIHAPTRGATVLFINNTKCFEFQSTLPHGERRLSYWNVNNPATFQSTLPHGERHCTGGQNNRPVYFNPRSHTGSDFFIKEYSQYYNISIHAPTRGATAILYKNFAYFHSYVTIINIHCISMHPFADA